MKPDLDRTGAGFTLIEILLSMSILAIAAGIIYGSLRTGLASSRKVEEKNKLFQKVRIIRQIISDDVTNAYVPKQSQGFLGDLEEFEGELSMGEGEEFDFSAGFPNAFNGRDDESGGIPLDRIEFYTISKGTFENDMPVYVSYYIDDDPLSDEEGLVMERITTILPAESFRKELAAEVTGIDVKYLDSTPEGQVWVDEWEEQRKLPRAVDITLIWNEESRKLLRYTDVPIVVSISATHVF